MKIAIIDDHILFGETLKQTLEKSIFTTVEVFRDAASFLESVSDFSRNDIIILDLALPKVNGLELLELLTAKAKEECPKILILSALNDAQTVKQAMRSGAMGYMSKSAHSLELVSAIRSLDNNEIYIEQNLKDKLVHSVFTEDRVMYVLSPREKEVLRGVCTGATIKEIAHAMKLSPNTVQTYHRNLMRKLKVNRSLDLVIFAIQNGLFIPNVGN